MTELPGKAEYHVGEKKSLTSVKNLQGCLENRADYDTTVITQRSVIIGNNILGYNSDTTMDLLSGPEWKGWKVESSMRPLFSESIVSKVFNAKTGQQHIVLTPDPNRRTCRFISERNKRDVKRFAWICDTQMLLQFYTDVPGRTYWALMDIYGNSLDMPSTLSRLVNCG